MPQRALAVVLLAALLLAVAAWWRWPSNAAALDCPDGQVSLDDGGVARCGSGAPLPAGQALTVGQKLDLNAVTAEDLALLPGVGPELARTLVDERTRLGGFTSWDQVDAVSGVGPARLETLQQACALGPH
ncbi:MAG: helix-hairpin-helix domain-containing protein [Myxococcales bacterium]|nr:helix-hairpin-helix domain-containing protein [Myxococcales bacterium]